MRKYKSAMKKAVSRGRLITIKPGLSLKSKSSEVSVIFLITSAHTLTYKLNVVVLFK